MGLRRMFLASMCAFVSCMILVGAESHAAAVGTSFTYQASLLFNGVPANGPHDFALSLFDVEIGGSPIVTTLPLTNQPVTAGVVLLSPDFGDSFRGDKRWMEIEVRPTGSPTFTRLSPRVELKPTPYALSLRPGAEVSAILPSKAVLKAANGVPVGPVWPSFSVGVAGRAAGSFDFPGAAVYGEGLEMANGVQGQSPDGNGVYGLSFNSNGVAGVSTSPIASGVYGENHHGGYGVAGRNYHANGIGLLADNVAGGVAFQANSNGGRTIEAYNGGNITFYVDGSGNVRADGTFTSPAADFAELLPADGDFEPGDVLAVGRDGKLSLTSEAFQTNVVGVRSTRPAFLGGYATEYAEPAESAPLALVGVVPVKVCDENGPVSPGDLLVASSRPGHAMAAGANPRIGTVIGKALGSLSHGQGRLQMVVTLQ